MFEEMFKNHPVFEDFCDVTWCRCRTALVFKRPSRSALVILDPVPDGTRSGQEQGVFEGAKISKKVENIDLVKKRNYKLLFSSFHFLR